MPAPTVRAGEPNMPAKKRERIRAVMVEEKAAPRVQSAKTGTQNRYTIRRPKVSLMGDAIIGPKARPST